MKPDVGRVLEHTAMHLMTEIVPAVAPAYRQSSVTSLGALLLCAREEFDRAASRRVDENQALRELFSRAAAIVSDRALARRLTQAADSSDLDLTIPALEASNQALREQLVELHSHIEFLQTDAARSLEDEIWHELRTSTERRAFSLSVF